MSQNLNFGTYVNAGQDAQNGAGTQKYCHGNNSSNCSTYGGLYDWPEMMAGSSACNGLGDGQQACSPVVQDICPSGWHVPSHYEWRQLLRAVCTSGNCASTFPYDNTTPGWPPVGTDEGAKLKTGGSSGLNLTLYGSAYSPNGQFYDFNSRGYYWSSTFSGNGNPWYQFADSGSQFIWNNDTPSSIGVAFALRCVKD